MTFQKVDFPRVMSVIFTEEPSFVIWRQADLKPDSSWNTRHMGFHISARQVQVDMPGKLKGFPS